MKAKLYEKVLFYVVIFMFWQIPFEIVRRYVSELNGFPRALLMGIIFAIMCKLGRKYIRNKFGKEV